MQKRRRYQRVRAEIVVARADGVPLGTTVSIGAGGMCLHASQPLVVGQRLPLRLSVPELLEEVTAQVVWVGEQVVGLAFVEVSRTAQESLTRLAYRLLHQGATLDDRRRCARESLDLPAVWELGAEAREGTVLDLAVYGALVVSGAPLPRVGDVIELRLVATPDLTLDPRHSACRADVRHVGVEGFGVEFVSPAPQFEQQVTSVLEQCASSA